MGIIRKTRVIKSQRHQVDNYLKITSVISSEFDYLRKVWKNDEDEEIRRFGHKYYHLDHKPLNAW